MSDETQEFGGLAEVEERDASVVLAGPASRRCACGTVTLGDGIVHGVDACTLFRPKVQAEREIFPAPLVTSRMYSEEGSAPSPVLGLAQRARGGGWAARVQHSVGHTPHATTGRPSAGPKRLWGVVMRSADARFGAYAVFDQGAASWKSVMLWGAELPHFPYATVTDLQHWLAEDARVPAAWYDVIRQRVAAGAAKRKAAARTRVKKGSEEAL